MTYARTAKAVWFRIGLAGRGTAASAGSPAVSFPDPAEATLTAAVPEAAPLPEAAQARRDPGPPGFDDLLASTVETARDAIGADTAYLLHEGGHGEPGVRAAAAAEPGRFTENDASRLQDLADQSAPVLERARLSAVGLA